MAESSAIIPIGVDAVLDLVNGDLVRKCAGSSKQLEDGSATLLGGWYICGDGP